MVRYKQILILTVMCGVLGCVGGQNDSSEVGGGGEAGTVAGVEAGMSAGMEAGMSASGCVEEVLELSNETINGEVSWGCGVYRIDSRLTIEDGTLSLGPCTTLEMGNTRRLRLCLEVSWSPLGARHVRSR